MRLTLFALPYKVKSLVPGWKGWRYNHWGLVWKEPCDCDNEQGCILIREYGEEAREDAEECKCNHRLPHTHTRIGYLGSKVIRFPKR
jgi:hypothetical protein